MKNKYSNRLMAPSRSKIILGMFWSLLRNSGGRRTSSLAIAILTSILTPQIFGLTGPMAVLLHPSQFVVFSGFKEKLIRKESIGNDDFLSVSWLSLAVSFAIYASLFFSVPFLANLYQQPALIPIVRVLTLLFVTNAFCNMHQAFLRRQTWFKSVVSFIVQPELLIGWIPKNVIFNFLKNKPYVKRGVYGFV